MLKKLTRSFLSYLIGIVITSTIITGFEVQTDPLTLLAATGILLIAQILIKPIIKLISFPINVVTLGFFEIVINAILLYIMIYFVNGVDLTEGALNIGYVEILSGSIELGKIGTLIASTISISIINWLLKLLVF